MIGAHAAHNWFFPGFDKRGLRRVAAIRELCNHLFSKAICQFHRRRVCGNSIGREARREWTTSFSDASASIASNRSNNRGVVNRTCGGEAAGRYSSTEDICALCHARQQNVGIAATLGLFSGFRMGADHPVTVGGAGPRFSPPTCASPPATRSPSRYAGGLRTTCARIRGAVTQFRCANGCDGRRRRHALGYPAR